jgi:proteic killer suppression protein
MSGRLSSAVDMNALNGLKLHKGVAKTSSAVEGIRQPFHGAPVARFANFAAVAIRKLQMVHAATRIKSLRVPPQNRLEKLSGDRIGQWSIRVNDPFRVCFVWRDGAAWDVEIVDYR